MRITDGCALFSESVDSFNSPITFLPIVIFICRYVANQMAANAHSNHVKEMCQRRLSTQDARTTL
jgi:hypothetical protein